jgi:hypothetical protein
MKRQGAQQERLSQSKPSGSHVQSSGVATQVVQCHEPPARVVRLVHEGSLDPTGQTAPPSPGVSGLRCLIQRSLLRLQQQYGNRYVQRTLTGRRAWPESRKPDVAHIGAPTWWQQQSRRTVIQRVLGPPYPFQGIITTRWNAALRAAANRTSRIIADLPRNTRVTAIANSGGWLQVQTTINGVVETGFVSHELVGNAPAAGVAPALAAGGRQEVTAFGAYNVYPDAHRGALQPNELFEAEFRRLRTAWTRVNDNSGGMLIHGAAPDVAEMRAMLGRGMARSQTFRNLIMEITEDAGHPVTINVGRNNAYWVDEFATNKVDLNDTAVFDENPRAGNAWASTQGELIIHWLTERRHGATQGGGFAPAHAAPLAAGGAQEQYRADIGQAGRVVSQERHGPAGGLHAGAYTDNAGNILRIRRDGSGGNPVPYEIRYEPAGGGAVTTRHNRIVAEVRSTSPSRERLKLKITSPAHDVPSPAVDVSAGRPLNFTTPLGGLVPAGANLFVNLYKEGVWILPELLLGITRWAHPFERHTDTISIGGVSYTIAVRLQMDP